MKPDKPCPVCATPPHHSDWYCAECGTPLAFTYSPWRHGGWYVHNVRYPSGAIGCVSRNYPDKKWRIVCDPRPDAYERFTYPNRDTAARAEFELIREGIIS